MVRNTFSSIILSTILCVISFPLFAENTSSSPKTIKVGSFINDILYARVEDEHNSSYVLDFIETLQRYNNWKFEFVDIHREEAASALESGRIDIIPFFGHEADSESKFLYSDMPAAAGSLVLAVKDIVDMSQLRIGLVTTAPKDNLRQIEKYARQQNITYSLILFQNNEDLFTALDNEKIDALVTIDMGLPERYKVVATLQTTFFYIAVSKKNPELYDDLNQALTLVTNLNPSFLNDLKKKYIPSSRYAVNRLTRKEQNYIAEHPVLRIAAVTRQPPFCYEEKGVFKGIIIDLLASVSKTSGLTFEYVPAKDFKDVVTCLKDGKADAVYAISDFISVDDAKVIKLTNPLFSQKYIFIKSAQIIPSESVTFAAIRGYQYSKEYIDKIIQPNYFEWYDNSTECINAVKHGSNKIAFLPSLEVKYYEDSHIFSNLCTMKTDYDNTLSIGLSRNTAPELCSILDKSISLLNVNMFEDYAEKNLDTGAGFSAAVIKHPLFFLILFITFIVTLSIIIVLFTIIHINKKKNKQIQQAMNLANRDLMTGLFNHTAFEKNVSGAILHRTPEDISIFIMLDIDNFKRVNDTCGHSKGDYVIVSIANILIATFRQSDIKCRMGGDEFAVFLKNVSDIEVINTKLKNMLITIEDYFVKEKFAVPITCSIGFSYVTGFENTTFKEMYNVADTALYSIKKNGKNQVGHQEIKNK